MAGPASITPGFILDKRYPPILATIGANDIYHRETPIITYLPAFFDFTYLIHIVPSNCLRILIKVDIIPMI